MHRSRWRKNQLLIVIMLLFVKLFLVLLIMIIIVLILSENLYYFIWDFFFNVRLPVSSHGVITQMLRQIGLKNTSPAGPGENVSCPHPIRWVVQTQRIKMGPQFHLVRRFAWGFKGFQRGFEWAIGVSAQL